MKSKSPAKLQTHLLLSRLYLVRNLEDTVFTAAMTMQQSEALAKQVSEVVELLSATEKLKSQQKSFEERFLQRKLMLVGSILTDPIKSHLKQVYYELPQDGGYIVINDLDHLRYCIQGQRSFESLWNRLDVIDDEFSKHLNFAYDENLGYLSSKLEWLGTGLKGEAVLHLPALRRTGYIQALSETAGSIGLTIKALSGGFYKLTNTVTLGRSELEIAILLDQTVQMLIDREIAGRETLYSSKREALVDELGRSFGLAVFAGQMEVDEATCWLSDILFAAQLGLVEGVESKQGEIYPLLCHLADEGIDSAIGRNLRQSERNKHRALLMGQWTQGLSFRR